MNSEDRLAHRDNRFIDLCNERERLLAFDPIVFSQFDHCACVTTYAHNTNVLNVGGYVGRHKTLLVGFR